MSKLVTGNRSWAETEVCITEPDSVGLDGAFNLNDVPTNDREWHSIIEPARFEHPLATSFHETTVDPVSKDQNTKRWGLPEGFVARVGRYGRTVLFEDNVYRLPNGLEFIPQPPSGTLGSRNHQYALLTCEQYEARRRGSVYVRLDGRIFDYAFDHGVSGREMFDTTFTIQDLERTGRYAPELKVTVSGSRRKKKKRARKKR